MYQDKKTKLALLYVKVSTKIDLDYEKAQKEFGDLKSVPKLNSEDMKHIKTFKTPFAYLEYYEGGATPEKLAKLYRQLYRFEALEKLKEDREVDQLQVRLLKKMADIILGNQVTDNIRHKTFPRHIEFNQDGWTAWDYLKEFYFNRTLDKLANSNEYEQETVEILTAIALKL